ncbi:MAG TPA: glutaredoxin [Ramlibacter sp.]|nr:glutaredoxin [Ramlibacter sp.]
MQIELYHLETCPYCRKVRAAIDSHGLGGFVEEHEVRQDAGALDRVEQLTGATTVPVLVVDGDPITESQRIIQWLEGNENAIRSRAAPGLSTREFEQGSAGVKRA